MPGTSLALSCCWPWPHLPLSWRGRPGVFGRQELVLVLVVGVIPPLPPACTGGGGMKI